MFLKVFGWRPEGVCLSFWFKSERGLVPVCGAIPQLTRTVFTVASDFDALDQQVIKAHFEGTWKSQKPVIFLSGKISEAQIAYLDATLGQINFNSPTISIPTLQTEKEPIRLREEKEGSVQSSIRFGLPAISRNHPDYFHYSVMNTVLGGYFGSRLQKNIREDKGFTYGVSSSLAPYPRGGYWVVGTDVNGENVEAEIRKMHISDLVSQVAAIPEVRHAMVAQQQRMGEKKGIVMDGRDIGTVVFPQAELKIFMTAEPHIRAQRRKLELLQKGEDLPLEEIVENLRKRDEIDSNRSEGPLKRAADAIDLDTSYRSMDEQVEFVLDHVRRVQGEKR